MESDYAGLGATGNDEVSSVKSKVKTGGPKITVETQYGSIRIHPAQAGESSRSPGQEDADEDSIGTSQRFSGADEFVFFGSRRVGVVL